MSGSDAVTLSISVIIPVLNEAEQIVECLQPLLEQKCIREILVVDGGSSDKTAEKVATIEGVSLLETERGRARQMNLGAGKALGEVLWFIHADTLVPAEGADAIQTALRNPKVIGGAFSFRLAFHHEQKTYLLRLIELGTRLRSKYFGVSYGDQAYFIRRAEFAAIGGFPDLPIMEDLYLWRSLRRRGKLVLLPQSAVTSARRWAKNGIIRTTLQNWLLILLNWCGVAPDMLAKLRR